jgi:hypothetical protein
VVEARSERTCSRQVGCCRTTERVGGHVRPRVRTDCSLSAPYVPCEVGRRPQATPQCRPVSPSREIPARFTRSTTSSPRSRTPAIPSGLPSVVLRRALGERLRRRFNFVVQPESGLSWFGRHQSRGKFELWSQDRPAIELQSIWVWHPRRRPHTDPPTVESLHRAATALSGNLVGDWLFHFAYWHLE